MSILFCQTLAGLLVVEGFLENVLPVAPERPRAASHAQGSRSLRIPFTDPIIVGTFVYHRHILEHEDKGMMQVIRVNLAGAPTPAAARTR